jgi:hypothetical protein
VIRAIEVLDRDKTSDVAHASYVVGLESNLPILSLVTDPASLWDPEDGIFINPWERGRAWERSVHMTFLQQAPPSFTENLLTQVLGFGQRPRRLPTQRSFEAPAGLRVHGSVIENPSESFETQKPSLRLYFRTQYGASRLEAQPFPAPNSALTYDRLLLHAGNPSDFNSLLCDHLVAEAAADLGLPTAKGRFVIMFINGELWGIYRLSERIDRFYLEDHGFGIPNADVVQEGRAREGSDADWDALIDWVEAHDLSDPESYAYIQTQIDLKSFTDFATLQLYFGFSPEALFAVRPQGGRWFWVYAGGTQAFTLHPEAPSGLLTDAAMPYTLGRLTHPGTSDFAVLLKALLANPHYRSRFAQRLTDVLNTTLTAERMRPRVERLTRILSPNIDYEISRWPGGLQDWAISTAQWRAFATDRPRGLREQFARVLDVSGTVSVTVSVQPPESGRLYLNGLSPRSETAASLDGEPKTDTRLRRWVRSRFTLTDTRLARWVGSPTKPHVPTLTYHYFPGTKLQAIAVPMPCYPMIACYHFVGWFTPSKAADFAIPSTCEKPECITPSPVLTLTVGQAQNGGTSVGDVVQPQRGAPSFIAKFTRADDDHNGVRLYPKDVVINEIWINDNGTRYTSIGSRQIEGDWVELWVRRPETIDLRGWRITDNDTKTGTDEGSLIFPDVDALASVPRDTVILIVATESMINDFSFPEDDLDASEGRMIFYVGNDNLDVTTDPGFGIGTNDDNVALLAPSDTSADGRPKEVGVDFVAEGDAVTPYTFGILADGVTFDTPFQYLGADDGALLTRRAETDGGWLVDPTACQSGDAICLESNNLVTPGALNPGQRGISLGRTGSTELLVIMTLIGGLIAIGLRVLPTRGPRR